MATNDYSEDRDTAIELCTEFGREVTLIQLDPGPANPAQPWRGATDSRATPLDSKTVIAVFVNPMSRHGLGLSVDVADFIAAGATQVAVVPTDVDLQHFTEMIDQDRSRWRVTNVQMLTPGPVPVLGYLGLKR